MPVHLLKPGQKIIGIIPHKQRPVPHRDSGDSFPGIQAPIGRGIGVPHNGPGTLVDSAGRRIPGRRRVQALSADLAEHRLGGIRRTAGRASELAEPIHRGGVRTLPALLRTVAILKFAVPGLFIAGPVIGRSALRAHHNIVALRKFFRTDRALGPDIIRHAVFTSQLAAGPFTARPQIPAWDPKSLTIVSVYRKTGKIPTAFPCKHKLYFPCKLNYNTIINDCEETMRLLSRRMTICCNWMNSGSSWWI